MIKWISILSMKMHMAYTVGAFCYICLNLLGYLTDVKYGNKSPISYSPTVGNKSWAETTLKLLLAKDTKNWECWKCYANAQYDFSFEFHPLHLINGSIYV